MMRRRNLSLFGADALLRRRSGWRSDVSAYIDDELPPDARARVEARLAESGEMQEYLTDLQRMHSVLRGLHVEPSPVSFQLTPEMLDQPLRGADEGRFSPSRTMAMASVAVIAAAAFAAAMVFDVIDAPSVQYAQTSASSAAGPASIPTTSVTTQQVEVQSSQPAAAAAPEASVASFAEQAQERAQEYVQEYAQEQQAAQQAAAETTAAARGGDSTDQDSAVDAEQAATAEPRTANSEQSRRALTAGRSDGGQADARPVSASAVLAASPQADQAQQSEASAPSDDRVTAVEAAEEQPSSEHAADTAGTADASSSETPAAAIAAFSDDGEAAAVVVTRTVRLVRVTESAEAESAWPLQERPRQPLAADPDWELPLQVALGSLAAAAALACLLLGLWDRRTV